MQKKDELAMLENNHFATHSYQKQNAWWKCVARINFSTSFTYNARYFPSKLTEFETAEQ
jgi:hypothetical protein